MPWTGITTRAGSCAICKKDFTAGTLVYFDCTKPQGSHLAHEKCYDDLRASRDKQPPAGRGILSTEELTPPF